MRIAALALTVFPLIRVPSVDASDSIRIPFDKPAADSIETRRRHHTLIGAAVGTASGAAIGLIATRNVSLGCKLIYPSDCNARRTERNIRIGVTVGTTAFGAGLGALVGRFLWK